MRPLTRLRARAEARPGRRRADQPVRRRVGRVGDLDADAALEVGAQQQVGPGVGVDARAWRRRLGVEGGRPRRRGSSAMWARPAASQPSPSTRHAGAPYATSRATRRASATAGHRPGRRPRAAATRTASHRVATSIVPCTHQRSGTVRRSAYSASHGAEPTVDSLARARRTDLDRRPRHRRRPPRPRPAAAGVRPPRRRRRRPAHHRRRHARAGRAGPGADRASRSRCPTGYVALVHPRSGLAARHGLSIVNTPGTVDAGYRGEIKVLLINHDPRRGRSSCAAATGSPSW